MEVGDRIRELRECQKKTMDDVAVAIGTKRQTIYKYEHGIISNIPYDNMVALAEYLHTTPAYLMGWTEEKLTDTIGAKIKARRLVLGMNQAELGAKLGYHNIFAIDKIEKGIVQLSPTRIVEFASVLQCTPNYLMGLAEQPKDGLELTEKEKQLILNYRQKTDIQKSVDILLGL